MNGELADWGDGGFVGMDLNFVLILATALVFLGWKRWKRGLTPADYIAIAVVAGSSSLIWSLGIVTAGTFGTFWRYHYPGYVMALPVIAAGVVAICGRWKRHVVWLALAVALAYAGNNARRAIRHAAKPEKHAANNILLCERWAADVIRKDYRGAGRAPQMEFDQHHYLSTRMPLVFSHMALGAYEAGARMVKLPRVLAGKEPNPNYFLLFDEEIADARTFYPNVRWTEIAKRSTRYGTYHVFRANGE